MRNLLLPTSLLALLIALALVGLVLSSTGDAPAATADVDPGPPPPCFDSWEEAEKAGYHPPDPNAPHGIIIVTDPTPTDGPPFDMTKTPPPPGFDSWDQAIDLWKEANDLGLFDTRLPPPTPEFEGPPPLGCSTWQEFIDWIEEQGIFGSSTEKPTPNTTPIAMRHFEEPPPPCFSSVEEMFQWFQSHPEGQPYVEPHLGRTPEPPFNCENWEEFYQYMEERFPDHTPTPAP